MRVRILFLLAISVSLASISGCRVSNKLYRPVDQSVVNVTLPPDLDKLNELALPLPAHASKAEKATRKAHLKDFKPAQISSRVVSDDVSTFDIKVPQLAFIEFDDLGQAWSTHAADRVTQLDRALTTIHNAVKVDPSALVVVFIHGWQHNAEGPKDEDQNIQAFKRVLLDLHFQYQSRAVVGVYIGWRGEFYKTEWPVSQGISYYNREGAAMRISSAGAITDALLQISDMAHVDKDMKPITSLDQPRPYLLFIGHSFGGLTLEHAITQAWIVALQQYQLASGATAAPPVTAAPPATAAPPISVVPPFADLTVFVNEAADATVSLPLLKVMTDTQITYKRAAVHGKALVDFPLILSVTTPADLATKLLLPIGHFFPAVGYKISGTLRSGDDPIECFDTDKDGKPMSGHMDGHTEWNYYMTTAAHMPALASHTVTEETFTTGQPNPAQHTTTGPGLLTCTPQDVDPLNPANPNIFKTYSLPGQCFVIEKKADRCNGTPYWIMDTDKAIIPAHSAIFTDRFIRFVEEFVPDLNNYENSDVVTAVAAKDISGKTVTVPSPEERPTLKLTLPPRPLMLPSKSKDIPVKP